MTRLELLQDLVEPIEGPIAEVGVHVGDFAAELLEVLQPPELFLIDAWRFIPGPYERDPMNRPGRDFEGFYRKVCTRFAKNPDVFIYRELSADAVKYFKDELLDLIYLDADHTEEGIRGDIERWWPKVHPGGVLAGHDYTERDWIDVIPVVDDFVEREGLELHLSEEPIPSWAVIKP